MEENTGNVKVFCRFRPLNEAELRRADSHCVEFSDDNRTVSVLHSHTLKFNFDYVFGPSARQAEVYSVSAQPIVEEVMKGFNGTVFAYGQTASGKTFTMTGPNIADSEDRGVIPRMVSTVFGQIEDSDPSSEFSVQVSYIEIYLEKIRDLLNPSQGNLKVREDRSRGIYIAGLTATYVSSDSEVFSLMLLGAENREVASTRMNAESSRSHSLFLLTIAQSNNKDFSSKVGKLHLVDLAGSEKVGKTGAEGKRLEEAKNINKSLTTLGHVINALTDGKSTHVPYRDSKLTRVLQDSLGGNAKTALIVTCSPAPYNEPETVSTLRFGVRAKAIRNTPKVNREYTVTELKHLLAVAREEITRLNSHIKGLQGTLQQNGLIYQEDETPKSESSDEPACQVLDEAVSELEELKRQLAEELENNTKAQKGLSEAAEAQRALKEECASAQKLCEAQRELIEQYEKKSGEVDELVEQLSLAKDSLQQEIEDSATAHGHTQDAHRALTESYALLSSELSELKQQPNPSALQTELTAKESQVQSLSQRLHKALHTQLPDLDDLRTSLTTEIREQLEAAWASEHHNLILSLKNRIDKVVALEIALDESNECYLTLESLLTAGERGLRLRTQQQEQQLHQVTMMYHQSVTQNKLLKVDRDVALRKVERLGQKNQLMQLDLDKTTAQLGEEAQKQLLLLEQLKNWRPTGPSNLRKSIRGGGRNSVYCAVNPLLDL